MTEQVSFLKRTHLESRAVSFASVRRLLFGTVARYCHARQALVRRHFE